MRFIFSDKLFFLLQFNQPKMYQYNQGSSGFNHCPPGFQPQPGSSHQWQFNGFQDGAGSFQPPPNYNYGNTTNFNQAPPPQWGNTSQQHWNNSWSYYNGNTTSGAGAAGNSSSTTQPNSNAAAEVSASYQRTLEYVQQCQQQQSWNNPSAPAANPGGNTQ